MGKKIRTIALVRGNSTDDFPDFLRFRSVVPPLGIMYLAAWLEHTNPGRYDVHIIDPGMENLDVEGTRRRLGDIQPDVVGISGLSPEVFEMQAIALAARRTLPESRIVIGGPSTTANMEDLASTPGVDCIVFGEGEETFRELLEAFEAGGDEFKKVAGIGYWEGERVVQTCGRKPIEDLDAMPYPAWDKIDIPRFSYGTMNMSYGIYKKKPYMPVFTTRGCPYRCTYCHTNFGKATRYRSPENVIREMELLYHEHGVREFHFFDDIFNLDKKRSKRIMDLIIERGLDVGLSYPNGVRGDIMDEELLVKMARAGSYYMCFAVESAAKRLQKYLKKNIKFDAIAKNISIARREGIMPLGFFMLGFPSETVDEIQATIDYACSLDLVYAFFFTVVPFEGTALAAQARERDESFKFDNHWTYHGWQTYYRAATGVDVTTYQHKAYWKFYMDPRRLYHVFRLHPAKHIAAVNGAKWFLAALLSSGKMADRLGTEQRNAFLRWNKS